MFEMATSFNSQQIQSRPPRDIYSGTSAQQADRELLRLISQKGLLSTLGDANGNPWEKDELCEQLICRFKQVAGSCSSNNSYDDNMFKDSILQVNNYVQGVKTQSNAEIFKKSCVLSSGFHRVLVAPNKDFNPQDPKALPYLHFSCQTSLNQPQCVFEAQS